MGRHRFARLMRLHGNRACRGKIKSRAPSGSWAVAGHDTPQTALRALAEEIAIRHPPVGCIVHSDLQHRHTDT